MRNAALIIATALTLSFLTTPLCFARRGRPPKAREPSPRPVRASWPMATTWTTARRLPGTDPGGERRCRDGLRDHGSSDGRRVVPWVNVKYLGPEEPLNLPDNVLDDAPTTGAVSDLRFELRYNAFSRYGVVTPFFAR